MRVLAYDDINEHVRSLKQGTIVVPVSIKPLAKSLCYRLLLPAIYDDNIHKYTEAFSELGDIRLDDMANKLQVCQMICMDGFEKYYGGLHKGYAIMCARRLKRHTGSKHLPIHLYANSFYVGHRFKEAAQFIQFLCDTFNRVFLYTDGKRKEDYEWVTLRRYLKNVRRTLSQTC